MGLRGAGGPPKNTRGRPRARCRRGPTGIELKGSAGIETVTADACAKLYTIGLMLPPKPAPVAGKCRRRRCDAPLRCRPNDHQGTTPSTERGCRLSSRGERAAQERKSAPCDAMPPPPPLMPELRPHCPSAAAAAQPLSPSAPQPLSPAVALGSRRRRSTATPWRRPRTSTPSRRRSSGCSRGRACEPAGSRG